MLLLFIARQQQTVSLKVFLSLLEHLLSKSGGDCTFIHQFIECQSEYRVFFTLILMKSGAKILKSEEKWGNQCIYCSRNVQVTIFRHQQPYLFLFFEQNILIAVAITYGAEYFILVVAIHTLAETHRKNFKLAN